MRQDCLCKTKTVKVPRGNAFKLLLPFKTAHWEDESIVPENIDILSLENVHIFVGCIEWADYEMDERGPIVTIGADDFDAVGAYNAEITADYCGVAIRGAFFECFTRVEWSFESNVEQHLPDSPLIAETSYVYIGITDDAELEELKQQYRDATAACETARLQYEAAKEEFDEKAEQLDDVAQQTTLVEGIAAQAKDATVAKQATLVSRAAAILEAIGNIHVDIPDNIATQEDVIAAKQAILEALSHIDIDTSDLAKEATLGAAPIGSSKTTVFQYLAAILDNIEGQGGEDPDIPEGVADRLAMIIEFFGIKPIDNYTFITDQQITDTLEDIWDNMNA